MDNDHPNIIVASSLEGIGKGELAGYLMHAYQYEGSCEITYNDNIYKVVAGDCVILPRCSMVTKVWHNEDCRMDVVYVTPEFIEVSTPQSNYGMKGTLSLFHNPVMHLTPEQQKVCALDFDYIKRRLALTSHNFHRDAMINAVQCMIIDFFDFHASMYGNVKISSQYAQLMEGFMAMLERGDYRKNREIAYYADKLCVTPKHLSDVAKRVSGFAANYRINRYTILDISRQLRNRLKTLTELSDYYGFSSPSYFSQYVQKHLGVKPTDMRD